MRFTRPLMIFCATACALSCLFATSELAANTNGNGVTLKIISTESDSYSSQSNSNGARLELAGMSQESRDTVNGLGAIAYIGILAPVGDEIVTDDETLLRLHLLGLYPRLDRFDVNGDTIIDIADLIRMRTP